MFRSATKSSTLDLYGTLCDDQIYLFITGLCIHRENREFI